MEVGGGGVVPLPGIEFVANENGLLLVSIPRGGGPIPPPHIEIEGNWVEPSGSFLLLASNTPLHGVKRRGMSHGAGSTTIMR